MLNALWLPRLIEDKISELILKGELLEGGTVKVTAKNGNIVMTADN